MDDVENEAENDLVKALSEVTGIDTDIAKKICELCDVSELGPYNFEGDTLSVDIIAGKNPTMKIYPAAGFEKIQITYGDSSMPTLGKSPTLCEDVYNLVGGQPRMSNSYGRRPAEGLKPIRNEISYELICRLRNGPNDKPTDRETHSPYFHLR